MMKSMFRIISNFIFFVVISSEHKSQQMKRVAVGSGSEEDPTVSGIISYFSFTSIKGSTKLKA